MGRSMSALESHAVLLKRLEDLAKPQGDYGKYETILASSRHLRTSGIQMQETSMASSAMHHAGGAGRDDTL
jgi:hypothetical protein